jgi:Family of unknown function (DUF5985)
VAPLNVFLLGAVVLACALAALFFLRFWRNTADRLFAGFAVTFALLAIHWTLVALTAPRDEHRPLFYLVRLAAFVTVLLAIVEKNRRRP